MGVSQADASYGILRCMSLSVSTMGVDYPEGIIYPSYSGEDAPLSERSRGESILQTDRILVKVPSEPQYVRGEQNG